MTVADLSLLALNFGFDGNGGAGAAGLTPADAAAMAGIDLAGMPEPGVLLVWAVAGSVSALGRRPGAHGSRSERFSARSAP